MIANYFRLSLNDVLWAMRVLVIVIPVLTYPVTLAICKEMSSVDGAGKRKTTNVVTLTPEGEYVATPAPVYVDDVHGHLAPVEVPTFIADEAEASSGDGVRTVER